MCEDSTSIEFFSVLLTNLSILVLSRMDTNKCLVINHGETQKVRFKIELPSSLFALYKSRGPKV
jgi:hypothetical protein